MSEWLLGCLLLGSTLIFLTLIFLTLIFLTLIFLTLMFLTLMSLTPFLSSLRWGRGLYTGFCEYFLTSGIDGLLSGRARCLRRCYEVLGGLLLFLSVVGILERLICRGLLLVCPDGLEGGLVRL